MTPQQSTLTIILIPGHWLGAWAWDEVAEHLTATGWQAIALTLPGLDDRDPGRTSRTLDDQAAAIEQAMRGASVRADWPAAVVAHSGANAPVSLVLDRYPELIGRMIWVDSGPVAPGSVFAADGPDQLTEIPLPAFEELRKQASLEGLTPAALDRFRRMAVPEPVSVLRQPVTLANDARHDVPTTLVCCSVPSVDVKQLAAAGHPMFAEVALLRQVDFVDLATGHWPMWSRPDDLARIIAAAAGRALAGRRFTPTGS